MTGSIPTLNRQHSSTTGGSTMHKTSGSKHRRSSSADDHNSMELVHDDTERKEILFVKRERTASDDDSGTEEIEQQMEHIFIATVNDNEDKLPTKAVSPNFDEGFSENENHQEPQIITITNDLALAKQVPDEVKKDFCPDTSVAFHGEFARLILAPLSLCHDTRYYLFAEEELLNVPFMNVKVDYMKLDNAKAQFKCPNPSCQHAWTSMRARISFAVSQPDVGFIVLKIFGQDCQCCGAYSDALWYVDEVCRVMKNLAKSVFERYFPDMINNVDLEHKSSMQHNSKSNRHLRHDPTQRTGKMLARHVKEHCEACRRGLCFPDNNELAWSCT